MLELLIKEGYSEDYINYLIEQDIDDNCTKSLYEKGFAKAARRILEKYFDPEDVETEIRTSCWGNRQLHATIFDRTWIEFLYRDDPKEAYETISVDWNYEY